MKKILILSSIMLLSLCSFSQNSAGELLKKGQEYMNEEKFMYAISKFSRVFKTFPTEDEKYDAYIYRAMCKRELKDFEESINDLNEAALIFPDKTKAYFLRAEYKNIVRDLSGASGDYSRIIKIEPDNAEAFYLRGMVQKRMKNSEKACLDFEKAKEFGYNKNNKELEKELNKCK